MSDTTKTVNISIGNQRFDGIDTIKVTNADNKAERISFVLPNDTQTEPTITTEELSITPSKSEQIKIPPTGTYYSKVTVSPVTKTIDSYIKPENIKKGITILGVTGTLDASGSTTITAEIEEVDDKTAMNNLLLEPDTLGKVYRFTGPTDDTYINGDLYEVVNK